MSCRRQGRLGSSHLPGTRLGTAGSQLRRCPCSDRILPFDLSALLPDQFGPPVVVAFCLPLRVLRAFEPEKAYSCARQIREKIAGVAAHVLGIWIGSVVRQSPGVLQQIGEDDEMDLEPFVSAFSRDMTGGKHSDRLQQRRGRLCFAFAFREPVGQCVLKAVPIAFGEPTALVNIVAPSAIFRVLERAADFDQLFWRTRILRKLVDCEKFSRGNAHSTHVVGGDLAGETF